MLNSFHTRFIVYFVVLAVISSALIYFAHDGVLGEKEISASFLAMIGTFLGATFAFRLNENKEHAKMEKERKAALNRALFVLIRQYNAIRSLNKQLAPFQSSFERAFNLPALRPPSYSDLTQNFQELSFMIELSEPNILMRLSVEQEAFHQTIESLRVRNDFYIDEIQPIIAKHAFNGKAVPAQEFESALGERLFKGAINSATILYEHVEESVKSLASMQAELFNAGKALYPDEKFILLALDV